ncbi:MAG TPA: flagellar hook-associated protein 3 [Bacteroidetes bacterium]|nr:flagellar hook-associated protein 3 [Bacteroidota bacterium]
MRISHQQIYSAIIRSMNKPLERLTEDQIKLATGRRINKPSDDPAGAGRAVEVRSRLMAIDYFEQSVENATQWLNHVESALDHTQTILTRAKELAVQGANDTLTDEDRDALAEEIDQLLEDLVSTANSKFSDKYVFGGTETKKAPVVASRDESGKITDVSFQSNTTGTEREIGDGEYVTLDITAQDVFGGDNGAIQALIKLRDGLRNNNPEDIRDTVDELDRALERSLNARTSVGAKINRLERRSLELQDEKLNLTQQLADLEDVDVAEVTVDLQSQEVAYRAALSVGAKLMQPSLLDYLG